MAFQELPPFAAWRHRDARKGFEVVFLHSSAEGHRFEGHTAAVEDGEAWAVRYTIITDANWVTRTALVVGQSATGRRELRLDGDGAGAWQIDGAPVREVAGCLDVDPESSSFTNAFPVHRLGLEIGQEAEAPAALSALSTSPLSYSSSAMRARMTGAWASDTTMWRGVSRTSAGSTTTLTASCSTIPGSPYAPPDTHACQRAE